MKKLGLLILGFALGALATYYFCPRTVGDQDDVIKKPKGVITSAFANNLNNNWTKYRKPAVDSCAALGGHKQDDRSVWWSAKELENYFKYAKKLNDSLNNKITGYRIYLGVYGEESGPDKCDLTTMFIVPTGYKNTSKASSLNLLLPPSDPDLKEPLFNDGSGGQNGHP